MGNENPPPKTRSKAMEIIAAIRRQLEINVEIAERDHPEGPIIDGRRVKGVAHSQDILAQHIREHLDELERSIAERYAPLNTPANPRPEGAFDGAIDTDTPLQAAAREAGWALTTLIDTSDWQKRDQLSDIVGRLAKALIDADVASDNIGLLEERISSLEDELHEAQQVPWPEWAKTILKTLQKYGYDPVVDGEVDLGEAFKDYLEGVDQEDKSLRAEIERLRAELEANPDANPHSPAIKTSIDTMREAAEDVLLKRGWKPGDTMSFHSITGLMAEFGMQIYRGDVGCGYPDCGCCADAACEDAIKQHPSLRPTSVREALLAAKKLADVMEGMTSSRSDDDFVWTAQAKIKAALVDIGNPISPDRSTPTPAGCECCVEGPPANPHVVGEPVAWTCKATLDEIAENRNRQGILSGRPLEFADSTQVPLYLRPAEPDPSLGGETNTNFRIEWIAAARPPVHPNPMTGKAWVGSFEAAIRHMKNQAADAELVSLTEVVTTTVKTDRSDDARAALATAQEDGR